MIHQIWMEGYIITGGKSPHSLVGSIEAETFKDAVDKWYREHPDKFFNQESMSVWGCRLFPTEEEARKLTNT